MKSVGGVQRGACPLWGRRRSEVRHRFDPNVEDPQGSASYPVGRLRGGDFAPDTQDLPRADLHSRSYPFRFKSSVIAGAFF
jgi:hypothetical protein